jgi:hypothetical protein
MGTRGRDRLRRRKPIQRSAAEGLRVGVSLTYISTEPVAAEVRKAIEADAEQLNKGRPWWCENITFFKHRQRPKHLAGDTKLFRGLGDDVLDDEDENAAAEVEFDDDQFMAFHDARFVLLTLARWSEQHGVAWVVEMSGSVVARVAGGRVEPAGLFESDASAEQLRADDERALAVHAKYA